MRGICCWLSMNLWITLCTGGRDEVNMHLAAIAQRTEIQQNLAAICISGFILKGKLHFFLSEFLSWTTYFLQFFGWNGFLRFSYKWRSVDMVWSFCSSKEGNFYFNFTFDIAAMTLKIQRIRRQWHWKSWSIFRMLLAPKILCNIGKSLRTVEQECAKEIEISANN